MKRAALAVVVLLGLAAFAGRSLVARAFTVPEPVTSDVFADRAAASAAGEFERGWMPDEVPAGARQLWEMHDPSSFGIQGGFRFRDDDGNPFSKLKVVPELSLDGLPKPGVGLLPAVPGDAEHRYSRARHEGSCIIWVVDRHAKKAWFYSAPDSRALRCS